MRIKAKDYGFGYLLSVDSDPKTSKSNRTEDGYLTAIMYLHPSKTLCPFASRGCLRGCLNTAGNPVYLDAKIRARKARTQLFHRRRAVFYALLCQEIDAFLRKCRKLGKKPAIRLNGTSDIPWELVYPELFERYHNVQFYDYTKDPNRIGSNLPANYDLTFSRSEVNDFEVGLVLARGGRVAVVVNLTPAKLKKDTPTDWRGWLAGNGDAHDLTFLRSESVLLLSAKGKARKDSTGFVDDVQTQLVQLEVA